jgi:hypothetical protein
MFPRMNKTSLPNCKTESTTSKWRETVASKRLEILIL